MSDDDTDNLPIQFESAYEFLNKHRNINLSNEIKLQLYANFKVATVGHCNTLKPSLLDFTGRAKWDAWKEKDDISKEQAMSQYIDIVEKANIGWNRHKILHDDDDDYDDDDDEPKEFESNQKERWAYVSTMTYEDEDDYDSSNEEEIFKYVKQGNLDEGLTLLHWACDRGHLDIVKFLIENGVDANILSVDHETPMHYACISEQLECARYLYRNGADLSIKDNEGLTAFEHCSNEYKDLIIRD